MTKNVTTDGAGAPLVPDGRYYIQDARSCVGNCVLFWAPNGAGYVCSVDEAGVYTGAYAAGLRDTDVAWPVDMVLAKSVRHCRSDQLPWGEKRHPSWRPVEKRRKPPAERCDCCGRFVSVETGRHVEPGVVRHHVCDDDFQAEYRMKSRRSAEVDRVLARSP